MTTQAPVIGTPLQFPNELYREIIDKLHYRRDRSTLLHLALVNKAWSTESQRMLFSTVDDDSTCTGPSQWESLVHTHTLVLQVIILNPSRLGSCVKTYKQRGLICPPSPHSASTSYLWDLTLEALPVLINLKNLLLIPSMDYTPYSWAPLLNGCTFKLETLRLGFNILTPNCKDSIVEFLRGQHNLLHLEVGSRFSSQDLSWLPDDPCPSLVSVACQLDSVDHVMGKRRHVVGLTTQSSWTPQRALPPPLPLGLRHLKYLSLAAHMDIMSLWQPMGPGIILLELANWDVGTIQGLTGFPNLRILALPRGRRKGMMRRPNSTDLKEEYNIRTQLTIEGFRRCPNLECVIIEDMRRSNEPRRCRRMTMSGPIDNSDASPYIQSEEFFIEHETGSPWWTAYGV